MNRKKMKTVIVIWCRYTEKTPMKESPKWKILKQEQVSEYDKDEKSSQTEKEEAECAVAPPSIEDGRYLRAK